jgi:hypothetical protein
MMDQKIIRASMFAESADQLDSRDHH